MVYGLIKGIDGSLYASDMRGRLKNLVDTLHEKDGIRTNISVECEGFLFEGIEAEQNYKFTRWF